MRMNGKNLSLSGIICIGIFGLFSGFANFSLYAESSVVSIDVSDVTSDPSFVAGNAQRILNQYLRACPYFSKEDDEAVWGSLRVRFGWIVVYLGEQGDNTEENIAALVAIRDAFGTRTFPNSIVFADWRDELASRWAHHTSLIFPSHGFSGDRSVRFMVGEAIDRINKRNSNSENVGADWPEGGAEQ